MPYGSSFYLADRSFALGSTLRTSDPPIFNSAFSRESAAMERELIDRAEAIQVRLSQLRDSL
jgi:hypothetical protein